MVTTKRRSRKTVVNGSAVNIQTDEIISVSPMQDLYNINIKQEEHNVDSRIIPEVYKSNHRIKWEGKDIKENVASMKGKLCVQEPTQPMDVTARDNKNYEQDTRNYDHDTRNYDHDTMHYDHDTKNYEHDTRTYDHDTIRMHHSPMTHDAMRNFKYNPYRDIITCLNQHTKVSLPNGQMSHIKQEPESEPYVGLSYCPVHQDKSSQDMDCKENNTKTQKAKRTTHVDDRNLDTKQTCSQTIAHKTLLKNAFSTYKIFSVKVTVASSKVKVRRNVTFAHPLMKMCLYTKY